MFAVNPPPMFGLLTLRPSSWSVTRGSNVPSLIPDADWPASPIHWHEVRSPGFPFSVGAPGKPVPLVTAAVVPRPQSIPS